MPEERYAQKNKIGNLTSAFDSVKELTKVNFDNNIIEYVKPDIFPDSLRVIHLSNNRLSELTHGLIPSSVDSVYLDGNQIREIPAGILTWRLQLL
ncbi:probable serine/threonine-protein kinase roco6 [Nematostella vectensis]|uniref:probable serine/threonine-protein kinase roco6 n=1 Tax=Nematostella vectensis TaxID=45351 RepID=UPI0020772277|nr:probable serine/threonine-protein kinase roco6 [Nematostella vectensis]